MNPNWRGWSFWLYGTDAHFFHTRYETKTKTTIFAATKWIQARNPFSGEQEYIKHLQSDVEIIDTIDEIDINPCVLTTYQVNDYVLQRYPPSKLGGVNSHKYGLWWRGPYQVTQVLQHCNADLEDKPRYSMHNLVTNYRNTSLMSHTSVPFILIQLTSHR